MTKGSARPTRRKLLQQAAVAFLSSTPLASGLAFGQAKVDPSGNSATATTKNRAPLTPNAFDLLPLGAIQPRGWLQSQLRIQAEGLTGHLDEIWPDVGPNSGWLGGTGETFERGPYYLDGLVPLSHLLNDSSLKKKAQRFIDWTLSSQRENGNFGPHDKGVPGKQSEDDWWPRMVMLKALTQYQEATGDARVIPFLERYFDHQLTTLPTSPLVSWGKFRWQDNALSVIWLYNRNGDKKLLGLIELLHSQGHDWQAQFANFDTTVPVTRDMIKSKGPGKEEFSLSTHGVNNGQALKAAPIWYLVSGSSADRAALSHQLAQIDRYHGLPNGMFSCDEHFAGRNPSQGSELCTVVEAMFSLEQSMAALGDASLGDRLERIAFNALPGTLTDDMWAHQYNQQANQIECGHITPWFTDGPESNLFGLEPNFGCCTANYHQGWPKFASSLWMASRDGGVAAAAYAPCEINTVLGSTRVSIAVATDYPFREHIHITVSPATPASFPLYLRIPAWANHATIKVNGKEQPPPELGSFARIERQWKTNDVVELRFPMRPSLTRWFNDSVAITRGPLVFSLPIDTKWVKFREHGPTADWEIYPQSEWNFGLAVDEKTVSLLKVEESPLGARPFAQQSAPVRISVPARKVAAWQATKGVADPVPPSPAPTSEKLTQIWLIPYAAAKLRVTAFPQVDREPTSRGTQV
jgi:DUF1680 family protein